MKSLNENNQLWSEIDIEELEEREEFGCFVLCFDCFCFKCFGF